MSRRRRRAAGGDRPLQRGREAGHTTTPSDHADCPEFLRRGMLEQGVDIVVSTSPPLVLTPYVVDPFVCPHGVAHWIEPTSEQRAAWARDGVA